MKRSPYRCLTNPKSWLSLSVREESFSASLPSQPGVYIFAGGGGEILYVGKSKNLKARVRSYFTAQRYLPKKTALFVSRIERAELLLTKTDLEAVLMEAELIRKLEPRYNARLRDDKSPLYILVTEEKFPRVLLERKSDLARLPRAKRQALFGPFLSSRKTKQVLTISRRLFPFCNAGQQARKACFYQHLGLCPGVCTGEISSRKYRANIRRLAHFLAGDFDRLRSSLLREMKRAAREQNYGEAQEKKSRLQALESLEAASLMSGDSFPGTSLTTKDGLAALVEILGRQGISLESKTNLRIEGYDVSNLGGRQATGAMVVFIDGLPAKESYRQFRVRRRATPDDPRMLGEVLRRRLGHPEWGRPDLVVIDGGQPQLQAIRKELGITVRLVREIPFVGLAKRPDRLVIPKKSGFFILSLPALNPGLKLLQAVRDEAHRFALSYHLKLRERVLLR